MRVAVAFLMLFTLVSCSGSTTITDAALTSTASAAEPSEISTEAEVSPEQPVPASEPAPALVTNDARAAVTKASFDDSEIDLERFAFELIAAGVGSRAPEPVDPVVLVDPVRIDTGTFAGLGFSVEGDHTKVLMVPGAEPGRPTAFAALLEQDSATSYQVLLSSLIVLDESDIMVEVAAHFGLRAGRARTFEGASHIITLQEPASLEGLDHYWILTIAAVEGPLNTNDLFDAAMAMVPPEVSNPGPVTRAAGLVGQTLNEHHLPTELGNLRFGMTLDEFTIETGLVGVPTENDNRTYVEQEFATGEIEWVQYQFYKPDHVLYEVIIDFRAPESHVSDLAFRWFGDPLTVDEAIAVADRATLILSHGKTQAEWLLATPDHFDVWSWTNENTVVLTTTMPGTEFGFLGED